MKSAKYGNPPRDLGLIDLSPTEMMFWLYLPIKAPGGDFCMPANVRQFKPIIDAVTNDCGAYELNNSYVYLTAKTMYVSPDCPGNRPGWHSDGFMTNDINYIWYDRNPTLFWVPDRYRSFTQDDKKSLEEMNESARDDVLNHRTYPCRNLLRLDESVIHCVGEARESGVRTFIKISVSRNKYDMVGNSINHDLDVGWTPNVNRATTRNRPSSQEAG